jgi:hypothetical protein
MKARVVLTVDLGDPSRWKRIQPRSTLPWRWVPDRRPLAEVLHERLAEVIQGVEEYVGGVTDATIEPIDTPRNDE